MSQHFFETKHNDQKVTVLLGFDRPLGHYFMVVEASSGQSDPIYSNLFQADPFGLSLNDFRKALSELGITVPESMFKQVELDKTLHVGNKVVWHEADGSFKEHLPAV